MMQINRNLQWEPTFGNQIEIEKGEFTITLTKQEIQIECGTENIIMTLEQLENLINELKSSR